MISTLII